MKKIIGYLVMLLVVTGVSAGAAYIGSRQGAANAAPQSAELGSAKKWLHEANLTAEQLEELDPVEAALKRDLDSLQIVLTQERLAMCSMLKDTRPTAEQLQPHVQRIAQLEAAQQDLVVKHLLSMSDVLTPDQKSQFYSAMMSDICIGCRNTACKPGTPCMCGQCPMGKAKGA